MGRPRKSGASQRVVGGSGIKKKRFPGGSGSSNPQIRTHRSRVRRAPGRRVGGGGGGGAAGGLSTAALAKHDDQMAADEGPPTGAALIGTFESASLEEIFAPIRRYLNSPLESHRHMCAVLIAMTESIKAQGVEETPTAHWAALMSTLEHSDGSMDMNTAVAVLHLLSIVFPAVPAAVLQSRFTEVAAILTKAATAYGSAEESQALAKAVLLCAAHLLSVQERLVWESVSATKLYRMLLSCVAESRPKVRKAARLAVASLIEKLGADDEAHPALSITATLVQQSLGKGTSSDSSTLHVLMLLESVLPYFPTEAAKKLFAILMTMLQRGNDVCVLLVANVLRATFSSKLTDKYPAQLIVQLLEGLHVLQPASTDTQARCTWNTLMQFGHNKLAKLDAGRNLALAPQTLTTYLDCIAGDKSQLVSNARGCFQSVMKQALFFSAPQVELAAEAHRVGQETPVQKLVETARSGLTYRYHHNYKHTVELVSQLFACLGPHSAPLAIEALTDLLQLHSTDGITCKPQVEAAVGSAIRSMGIEAFWVAVPLGLEKPNSKSEFPRAWLLPVMQENISKAKLSFFMSNVLQLAADLIQTSEAAVQEGHNVIGKAYHTLFIQVWSLLPGFCDRATDVTAAVGAVGKLLVTALKQRDDLRAIICKAIVVLVESHRGEEMSDSAEEGAEGAEGDAEALTAIGATAAQILPTLFNGYCVSNEELKLSVIKAVAALVSVTPEAVLAPFFHNVVKKLLQVDAATAEGRKAQHEMMDLALTMIPHIPAASLSLLFRVIKPQLKDSDSRLQKKSYRALLQILESTAPAHVAFVKKHLGAILELLATEYLAQSESKHHRLRCFQHVVPHLTVEQLRGLDGVIVEVVLSTKEVNERARHAAFEVLVRMSDRLVELQGPQNTTALLDDFYQRILGLLTGDPFAMSGAILALSRVLYEHSSDLDAGLVLRVVDSIIMLLSSRTREVVKSAIGFVKVTLVVLPADVWRDGLLQKVVDGLLNWSEDSKRSFKSKVKLFFDRLIRKFGYDVMLEVTPPAHHKLLANIRKLKAQKKKKKGLPAEAWPAGAANAAQKVRPSYEELIEDSDDENGDGRKGGPAGAQPQGIWISENAEDTLDFLDPSANRKISAAAPGRRKAKTVPDTTFGTAEDGRLLVKDLDMAEEHHTEGSQDEDSEDEGGLKGLNFGKGIHRDRARRKRRRDSDDEDETAEVQAGRVEKRPAQEAAVRKGMGAEFRSKKAGGDVRKKGMPMPYAYLPLDKRQLNRRKTKKASGEFRGIVKGAQRGAKLARKRTTRSGGARR